MGFRSADRSPTIAVAVGEAMSVRAAKWIALSSLGLNPCTCCGQRFARGAVVDGRPRAALAISAKRVLLCVSCLHDLREPADETRQVALCSETPRCSCCSEHFFRGVECTDRSFAMCGPCLAAIENAEEQWEEHRGELAR
jgi:hypothetical protein